MKKYSASQISFIISFVITILVSISLVLNHYFGNAQMMNFITIPIFFISSLFIIRYIIGYCGYGKTESMVKLEGEDIRQKKGGEPESDVQNEPVSNKSQKEEIERLKDLEKYRKEFVGNVSHELKTPIFNIQGYILTLLEGAIDDTKINKLYLQRAEKSIDRMISIVEDLESITKLESGELKLKLEVFDMVKLVEDVFEMEQMLANEQKISFEFRNKYDLPVLVNADKKRITEVLSNLVVNSIKYGRKKGFVSVSIVDQGNQVLVEVNDNGIGIQKKDLPRIFERFYRVDKSRSREQGGTGLGLSIVKHIIEAHNQTIKVNSLVDKGTTFSFTLEKAK